MAAVKEYWSDVAESAGVELADLMDNPTLAAALVYSVKGYQVFPCWRGSKRPATQHGLNDATTDPAKIIAWWTRDPRANIAIRTDGLLVVDVDGAGNDYTHVAFGFAPRQRTPRGGTHHVFRQTAGLRNSRNRLAPDVDTRADGGYICVAPSVVDGVSYKWEAELAFVVDLPPAPHDLVDRLR